MIWLDVRKIVASMGGNVVGRNSVNVPGPGHSPADRSLTITLNSRAPAGFVVYSHSGDDPIVCRDYVRERLGLPRWQPNTTRIPLIATTVGPKDDNQRLRQVAMRIWQEAVDPRDTAVEYYLREHRGLSLPIEICGSVLRFHPNLYYSANKRLPGMVALFRDIAGDQPRAIHRTWLDPQSGDKIGRKTLGSSKGAAIKFDSATEFLTIGEGIESVMSARALGYSPAWALGSSGPIGTFPLLKVSELTVLEENDTASRRDVKACAERYLQAKRPVTIVSSDVGSDLNDAWRAVR